MPNPTYEEVRSSPAYANIPDEQLRLLYEKKFGGPQPEWLQKPTAMSRLKALATDPTLLKGLGISAGLALAPEGTIPAMVMGGAGSVGGGLASSIARDEHRSGGQMALDAAEGATVPLGGKIMQGGAAALRTAGKVIPKNIGFYGALSGHPGLLALRAAVAESGLPKLLDFVGGNYNKVINAVQGSLRSGATAAEEAAGSVGEMTHKPWVRKSATGVEKPYRMGGGVSTPPYEPQPGREVVRSAQAQLNRQPPPPPSAFERAMAGPEPELTAVHPAAPAGQVDTAPASEILDTIRGMNPNVPTSRARLAVSHPQPAPVQSVAGLQKAVSPAPGSPEAIMNLRRFGNADPYAGQGGIIRPPGLPMEGTPEEALAAWEDANAMRPAASHAPARPAPGYIHPADTSGSQFGFDRLPPISEGELSRLQALFKRVGAPR